MSLRQRTTLLLSLIILASILVLYFILSQILLRSFAELEEQEARQAEARTVNAVNDLLLSLEATTSDYAYWNDMAEFADKGDPAFIENNFYDETFANLRLNFVVILDNAGQVLYEQGYDWGEGTPISVPQALHSHLQDGSTLQAEVDTKGGAGGILVFDDYPLLLYARPIRDSLRGNLVHGTLVMARLLDENAIARVEALSQTELTFQTIKDSHDKDAFLQAVTAEGGILFQRQNEEVLMSYTVLNDLYGMPALVVRIDTQRDIYQRGTVGMQLVLITVAFVSLVFAGVHYIMLEGFVLKRLDQLVVQVTGIRDTQNLKQRITMGGRDELNRVADSINEMLESLAISQTARENAEAANRAKSRLLSFISHELKTPLTSITLNADLIRQVTAEHPNEKLARHLSHITNSTMRMDMLIKDLLDTSRIEAREMQLELVPVKLPLLLQDVTDSMLPAFSHKRQHVSLSLAPDLPLVLADRERLTQILLNLLSNAHKYTPEEGKIAVRATRDPGGQQFVRVTIQDTGIGLEPNEQIKVFEKFFRSAKPEVQKTTGTGLGLHITRSLVEMHGGHIWFESNRDEGTTFSFTLPLYPLSGFSSNGAQV